MGTIPKELKKVKGSNFSKLFGSGGGTGFSAKPNFSVYAMMHVWENKESANHFFKSELYDQLCNSSLHQWTLFFKTYSTRGEWDKSKPFVVDTERDLNAPVVVITRASIKTKHVFKFWKRVPDISRFILTKNNNIFSVGIGEVPWFYQVTFSIWENEEAMVQFAHKDKFHAEAAKISLNKGWFKEYMFNRFYLTDSNESWSGENPFTLHNK